MESLGMRPDSVTSAIKRRVKDKRASKTTLNASLASKIKTKIINNSSIFKISLKHNNRALAQALSREKENARRIATEKTLLQKEVERLNFENTFLQLKLDNLNKKLIEIESLLSNNLITAIEMCSLSEFHQSSFLPSTSKKKRPSRQCELMRLPFARVPLPSNDDDDDDKEKTPRENSVASRLSPDTLSSVSIRQSAPTQCNVDTLFLKENNQSMYGPDDAEHISSSVSVPPKESHSHLDQSSQSAVVGETTNGPCTSQGREKLSLNNVTERKKRGPSWASDSPASVASWEADSGQQPSLSPELGRDVETEDCANEKNITVPGNPQGLAGPENPPAPSRKPGTDSAGRVQDGGDAQGQTTVYGADMELTATDVSTIVTVSRGSRRKSNKKMNDYERKALRKVRTQDRSSETKRERSKRKCKISVGVDAEGQAENGLEGSSALMGRGDVGDPDFILSTAQLPPANLLRKTTLPRGSDREDRHSTQGSREETAVRAASGQGGAPSASPSADGATRERGMHEPQNSLACSKSKASRQTFVIRKLEKDRLFPNQENKETISENLEVAHEFQAADLSSKENENLCVFETQNLLKLKKCVSNRQPAQQAQSEVTKLKQKVNRKTEIISQVSQRYEDNGKEVHASQQRSIFFQPRVDKETVSGNLGVAEDFHMLRPFLRDHGNLCDRETQNSLDLQKPITPVFPVQQNESKINKKLRQKVNRKTEIISEVNHFDDDKSWCCSEKGNSLSPQKENEIIPGDPRDLGEFQSPALPTQDGGRPCGHETRNVSAVREQIRGVHAACREDSEAGRLGGQGYESTEVTSELARIRASRARGLQAPGKGDSASEHSEVTREFQTLHLPTRDHGNSCDYETQRNCVTSLQLPQRSESKTSKLRQKVNRKTEITSEMIQIYEDIDNDVHGQKHYSEDLNFKINKSKPRLNRQGLIGECYVEINSNAKENYSQIPNPPKLVKKHRKKSSGKGKSILTTDQSKLALPSAESSQTPAASESGVTRIGGGPGSAPGGPAARPGHQRPHSVTADTKGDMPGVEARKARQCQATEVTKATSRAQRRKISTAFPPGSAEAVALAPRAAHRTPAGSEHEDQENRGESEKAVGAKLDFDAQVFRPFSQIYSPNIQGSSSDSVHEGSVPGSVSSSKIPVIKDHSAPEHSPIFQVRGARHEKTKEVRASVSWRAQKPETGNRTLQDLTNTSFFSSNTAKSESESGDGASQPPSKKRRCTPLSLKEPSLKRKMRR